MGKATRFLLAIALIIVGTAVAASHPEWSTFTTVAVLLLLLAGAIAAGVLAVRSRSDDPAATRNSPGLKVSNNLLTLSSAAILAVYAAGYHRTGSAEDKYAGQSARRRASLPLAASAAVPAAVVPGTQTPRAVTSPAPPIGADHSRTSVSAVPKLPSASAPSEIANSLPVSTAPGVETPATLVTPPVAAATPEPVPLPPAPQPPVSSNAQPVEAKPPRQYKYKDGTFLGWGYSRHGDIQASVVIKAGQIISAEIERCQTRYPCSWIENLPGQAVSKQSADVDVISGASESSYAYSDAVIDALSKASE